MLNRLAYPAFTEYTKKEHMSDVSVSIKLTQKEAGKLYMAYQKRGDRIKELRAGLKRVIALAEESKDFAVVTAAKAALEVKSPDSP
jgi:hypothetical protein